MTIKEVNEAAKAAGMTYGEYVIQNEAPVEAKDKPDDPFTRTCVYCGRKFQVDSAKSKKIYCSTPCAHDANNEKARERAKVRYEQKKAEKAKDNTLPDQDSQKPKRDAGKARLTLVPTRIIWDVAAVRQYGVEVKYPETGMDGWRDIGSDRIKDAAMRHFLRYLSDPNGKDEESGLPHLWHLACNIAFLCELEGSD